MRRCVTVVRTAVHAFVLLLALLLAAQGASTSAPPASGERAPAAVQFNALSSTPEVEHTAVDLHARRTVRSPAAPPAPGERPTFARSHRAPTHAAHTRPLPRTGSAGMPWSRTVDMPVLHQVFRH